MAALTWQTVRAANQADAINLLNQGARSIQSGISGAENLANRLGQQEQAEFAKHKAAQTEQLLGQIAATTDRDEALALRDQLNTDYLRTNYKDAIDVNQILSAAKARPDAIRQSTLNERTFNESEARRGFEQELKNKLAGLVNISDPAGYNKATKGILSDTLANSSGTLDDLSNIIDQRTFLDNEVERTKALTRKDFEEGLKYDIASVSSIKDTDARRQATDMLIQGVMADPSSTMADVQAILGSTQLPQAIADVGTDVITPEQRLARKAQIAESENQATITNTKLGLLSQNPYSTESMAAQDAITAGDNTEYINDHFADTPWVGKGLGGTKLIKASNELIDDKSIVTPEGVSVPAKREYAERIINRLNDDQRVELLNKARAKFGNKKITTSDLVTTYLDEAVSIKPRHINAALRSLTPEATGEEKGDFWWGDNEIDSKAVLRQAAMNFAVREAQQRTPVQEQEKALKMKLAELENIKRTLSATK